MSSRFNGADLRAMSERCEEMRQICEIEHQKAPTDKDGPLNSLYIDLHVARDSLLRAAAHADRYLAINDECLWARQSSVLGPDAVFLDDEEM